MSEVLQHIWAWVFTIFVVAFTSAGVAYAVYMRTINYRSKRHMWTSIKPTIDPPFNPYPERPIAPERYRQSDEEIERQQRMEAYAAGDELLLMKLRWSAQDNEIKHLDGVPWHQAPLPPKNHVCWPQTDAWIMFRQVQRCSCGAIRDNDDPTWSRINERTRP